MASDPSDVRVDMAAGTNGNGTNGNGSTDEIRPVNHAELFRQNLNPSQSKNEAASFHSSPRRGSGRRMNESMYSIEDAFKPKDFKMERVDLSKRSGPEELPSDMWTRIKTFVYNDYYVPREAIRSEIVAGLIVGLAVVPEAIAFALVVGIKPQWGVDTTLITTFVVGVFGGRPGLCNGASGAVAVVIKDVVEKEGVEYMGYTVILAGLFCCLFGVLRLANYMTLVSSSVMIGFVNALAIIIGCAQVKAFKADLKLSGADAPPALRFVHQRRSSFDIFVDGKEWVGGAEAAWMLLEVATCMLTMILLPLIKHDKLKWIHYIPSPPSDLEWGAASLIGLLLATFVEHAIVRPAGFETRTIGDLGEMKGELPRSLWDRGYDVPPLNADTFGKILPTAATLAAVALIEQMMTLQLVDQMTKTVGQANREGVGLGLGNIVAGLIGGMGGNAMIGQSVICIKSGGFRRLSNMVTGFTVLLITVALFKLVNLMPAAAFVGMMWMICYYTFEWNTFRLVFHAIHNDGMRERFNRHYKIERSDVLVVVVVTIVTLFSNLAMAVACGLALNLIAFAVKSGETVRLKAKFLLTPHPAAGGDAREEARKAPPQDGHVPYSELSLPESAPGTTEEDEAGSPVGQRKVATMVYEIEGPLFFGSVKRFLNLFDQDGDPEHIEIHCSQLSIMDFSATEALCKLSDEYKDKGKKVHLRFLGEEHLRYLQKAKDMTAEKLTILEVRKSIAAEHSELEHYRDDHVDLLAHRDPMHA